MKETKDIFLNDVVETGASKYFRQRAEEMRYRFQLHLPDCWTMIYLIVLLRTIYGLSFRQIRPYYENNILYYLYPELNFCDQAITVILKGLGRDSTKFTKIHEGDGHKGKT